LGWSSATLDNGSLYFGATTAKVYALDAATGVKKWEYAGQADKPLQSVYSTPVTAGGRVYFGAYDGVLYALDAANGSL
jgi:outer membrane protein assembly factor BamB